MREKYNKKCHIEYKIATQIAVTPILYGIEAKKILKESKTMQTIKSKENAQRLIKYFGKFTKRR